MSYPASESAHAASARRNPSHGPTLDDLRSRTSGRPGQGFRAADSWRTCSAQGEGARSMDCRDRRVDHPPGIPAQGQNPAGSGRVCIPQGHQSPLAGRGRQLLVTYELVAVGCRSWRYHPPSMAGDTLEGEPSSTAPLPERTAVRVRRSPRHASARRVSLIVFMISRAPSPSPASSGHTDAAIPDPSGNHAIPTFLLSLPPSSSGMFLQPYSHATVIDTPGLDGLRIAGLWAIRCEAGGNMSHHVHVEAPCFCQRTFALCY